MTLDDATKLNGAALARVVFGARAVNAAGRNLVRQFEGVAAEGLSVPSRGVDDWLWPYAHGMTGHGGDAGRGRMVTR